MNLLIVGGAGYIGSHACKVLAERGVSLINLDNLSRGHREFTRWGEFIEGDLGDRALLDSIFRTHQIDAVMHFAALAYVGESVSQPDRYYLNNVQKPLVLLDAMVAHGVKHFIFSSTCATYGEIPAQHIPVSEEFPQNPVNPYGRSKYFFEQILKDFDRAFGLKSVFLRYFNAAGADPGCEIGEWHEPETHLIPLAFQAALGGTPLTVFGTDYEIPGGNGDGTCVRDYIHILDLVEAHILALHFLKRESRTEAFNLGNGRGFSVLEVIRMAEQVSGLPVPFTAGPRRPGDPGILVGSAAKAREVLGWKPRFADLRMILETAWAWEKKRRTRA